MARAKTLVVILSQVKSTYFAQRSLVKYERPHTEAWGSQLQAFLTVCISTCKHLYHTCKFGQNVQSTTGSLQHMLHNDASDSMLHKDTSDLRRRPQSCRLSFIQVGSVLALTFIPTTCFSLSLLLISEV